MTNSEAAQLLRRLVATGEVTSPYTGSGMSTWEAIAIAIVSLDPGDLSCWCEACGATHRMAS